MQNNIDNDDSFSKTGKPLKEKLKEVIARYAKYLSNRDINSL